MTNRIDDLKKIIESMLKDALSLTHGVHENDELREQRKERWEQRCCELISDNISTEEANKFNSQEGIIIMGQPELSFRNAVNAKTGFLKALKEDMEKYPEEWRKKFNINKGKAIKKRLEIEGLFVESRSQNEDEHLFIGKKDGLANKAHIVIDGKTGEIRIDDKDQPPEELVSKIETILTLNSGKKIKTTRGVIEELQDNKPQENLNQNVANHNLNAKLHLSRKIKGTYSLGELYNLSDEDILDLNIALDFIDKTGERRTLQSKVIDSFEDPIRSIPVNPTVIKKGDILYITDFPRTSVTVLLTGVLAKSKCEYRQEFKINKHQN